MQSSTSKILTLFKQSFTYSAGNLFNKLLLFLLIPIYANFIDPEDLSLLEILDPAEQFIFGITNLGLIHAFYRYYTKEGFEYSQSDVFSTSFWLIAIVGVAVSLVLYLFRDPISAALLPENQWVLYCYILTIISLFIRYFFLLGSGAFNISQEATGFASWNALGKFLFVLYAALAIGLLGDNITAVFEGRLLSLIPVALLGIWYLRHHLHFRFKPRLVWTMLKFSYPFILTTASYPILTYIDRWMLSELAGSAETGIYGISYRFGMVPGMLLVQPFLRAWRPFIYNYDDKETQEVAYKRILLYYTLVGAIVWLGISTFSEEIVKLITSPDYYPGHVIIPYVASSQLFYGLGWIVIAGLAVKERTFFIGFITFLAAILNVALNYYFIPEFGMLGAAYSTLASFLFIFIGYSINSYRKLPLRWPYKRLLLIVVSAIIAYYIISFVSLDSIWLQIISKAIAIIPAVIVLSLMAGLNVFKLNEIKKLLKGDDK